MRTSVSNILICVERSIVDLNPGDSQAFYIGLKAPNQLQVTMFIASKEALIGTYIYSVGSQLLTCFSYQHYVFQLSTLLNY